MPLARIIRIATRKSPLALWQANYVAKLIQHHWPMVQIELLPLQTSGDRFLKTTLQSLGGKGLFVKELEEALLDGRADLAVHSVKDVPAHLPQGLTLAAYCKRENPFDAFVSSRFLTLSHLPLGSRIGTASSRRQAQLLAYRPDLIVEPIRGNIHTRLAKLEQEGFDAIVLAAAGLIRMEMAGLIQELISEECMLPACGQGAIGIECRQEEDILKLLHPLNDSPTASCIQVERQVNALLGGNCQTPLAVYCTLNQQTLHLQARLLSLDGKHLIQSERRGELTHAISLAKQCANDLYTQGAADLLKTI